MFGFASVRSFAPVVLGLSLALVGCSKEGAAFKQAQEANSIEGYESFLQQFPETDNKMTVEQRLDELYFEKSKAEPTEESLRGYLAKFPQGAHSAEVRGELEGMAFKKIAETGDKAAFEAFVAEFPNGNYTEKAKTRIDELGYGEKITTSDVKVTKVKVTTDAGEVDGWEITGTLTNSGDRNLSALSVNVGPMGAGGVAFDAGALEAGKGVPFSVKTTEAPAGWDETSVGVKTNAVAFAQ